MYTRARTEAAISRWLMSSLSHPDVARQDWLAGRHAVLRTGVVFDAVRMHQALVHAAVGSTQPDTVSGALAEIIDGPVISDPPVWFYALVPPGACEAWRSPYAQVRGPGGWLGVPRVDRVLPVGLHWSVPVEKVGRLCGPDTVAELLRAGATCLEGTDR
ncbi:hypothetical protein ACIBJC_22730 [Streptomyces sp. NPDC050509]|uniref:hypothetical protein n=1 Tax=Streptomyces sp. NPDC050509 TaxID=3365620 RepID=UPI0037890C53